MVTELVAAGLSTCEVPATLLNVRIMMLDVVVEGEEQLGDPACGAIVQYVGVKSCPASTLVVFMLAIFPTLFSANQAALRGESYANPIGPELSDGSVASW
jgi:hypothetical protein